MEKTLKFYTANFLKYNGLFILTVVFLLFLYLSHLDNYVFFHSMVELFATIIAGTIFIVAWGARDLAEDDYVVFVGVIYLAVALINSLHFLSYKGMGVFDDHTSNLATQLWLAERYLLSISFLFLPFFFGKKIKPNIIFGGITLVTIFILATIFYWKIFPVAFVDGVGLTPFKIISEYVIIAAFVAVLITTYIGRKRLNSEVYRWFAGSIICNICAELFFTAYVNVYAPSNMIGHLFIIGATYCMYRAAIDIGLSRPFDLLFRNLKHSNDFNKSLLTAIPFGIDIVDTEGTILFLNDVFLKKYGPQAIGKKRWQLIQCDENQCASCPMKQTVDIGEINIADITDCSEKKIYEITRTRIIYNNQTAFLEIFKDVSERKQIEEELRLSKARYRAIINNQNDLICRVKPDGTITFANQAYCDYYGAKPEQLVGTKYFAHLLPEDQKKEIEYLKKFSINNPTSSIEHQAINGQGEVRWQSWNDKAIFDKNNKIIEFQFVGRDITDIRKKEEELRLIHERTTWLARFPEENPNPVLRVKLNGEILYANPAAKKIHWPENLVKPGKLPEQFLPLINQTLNSGKGTQQDIEIDQKIFSVTLTPFPQENYVNIYYHEITRRKQAEAALRKSEESLRRVTELLEAVTKGANVLIATIDKNLCYTYFNEIHHQELKKLTGKNTVIGMSLPEALIGMPADQQTLALDIWNRALKGETISQTIEFGDPGRFRRYYNTKHTPIWNEEGKIIGAGEITSDITALMSAQKALQESETKFRTIFKNSPVGIARFDKHGVITDCNESYTKIVNAPKEKIIGFNLLTDTIDDNYKDAVQQCLSGKIGQFEGHYLTIVSRKELVMKAEFGPFFLDDDTPDGGIQIIEDFTERERIKNMLKEHTDKLEILADDLHKFELAVESASDAIAITDRDGKIVYANKVTETMTGYSQKDMIGQKLTVLGYFTEENNPEAKISFGKAWKEIVDSGGCYIGEIIHKRKGGQTYISDLRLAPVLNEEKQIIFFVATARDITKNKEIDRAKTEFVSLVSHQLRTPLAAISLAAELLLRGAGGRIDERQKQYLDEIFNSTKNMTGLINNLLNVSRIELGTFNIKPEKLDPVKSTEEILNNLKAQIKEKKIKIERDFNCPEQDIMFDKNAFGLIVENFITNAIRYTPPQGRVRVGIECKNKLINVEVSDTGYGIPPEASDKIFSKLFRATNAQEIFPGGEGLGLYIVKSVAERVGAKVWFKPNDPDPGTTFHASLPTN